MRCIRDNTLAMVERMANYTFPFFPFCEHDFIKLMLHVRVYNIRRRMQINLLITHALLDNHNYFLKAQHFSMNYNFTIHPKSIFLK